MSLNPKFITAKEAADSDPRRRQRYAAAASWAAAPLMQVIDELSQDRRQGSDRLIMQRLLP